MLDAFYDIFGKGHGIYTVKNEPCYSVWALGDGNIKSQVHRRKQCAVLVCSVGRGSHCIWGKCSTFCLILL